MTGASGSKLSVLAIHRYYAPDTPPYAAMLKAIAEQWVNDGHSVDVLSSQPSYKPELANVRQPRSEDIAGVHVRRLNLPSEAGRSFIRIINALRLGLGVLWQAVFCKRYDIIMVSTSPPVLAGWFAALAAKLTRARFVYHCMDIHPEIGRVSGEFRNRYVYRALSALDAWSCKRADPVVVLSNDMALTLAQRKPKTRLNSKVINNFSLPSSQTLTGDLPFVWPEEQFVLLFAGNIGRFQGLDTLMSAIESLKEEGFFRLVMMGDGVEKARFQQMAEERGLPVTFVGHQSVEVAKCAMNKAQAGFVSLVPELYKFAYPSKTMTYLEQGCPVIVSAEVDSCLAKDITYNGAGVVVANQDAEALAVAIRQLASDESALSQMSRAAEALAHSAFDQRKLLEQWSLLLTRKTRG